MSNDHSQIFKNQLTCPACSGSAESYFANGYTCPICGRKESLFLKAIKKDRTITNEGINRIGDTIADLRIQVNEMVDTLRMAREALDNDEFALCAGIIDAAMKIGAGDEVTKP